MVNEASFKLFLDKALRFLSFRPRSRNEILRYLETRVDEGEEGKLLKDRVLKKLESLGLVDDREFAAWLIGQRLSGRNPRGWLAIRGELLAKGVPQHLIARLSTRAIDGDLGANIFSYLSRKEKGQSFVSRYERQMRLVGLLLRRGFDSEDARNLVDKYLAKP